MLKGKVDSWNEKGFGFIKSEDGKDMVYVHFSGIDKENNPQRTLQIGQDVEYIKIQGAKGFQAINVKVVE